MSIIRIFLIVFYIHMPVAGFSFALMLDPAGDAKHAGRAIDDCFERGITLQFVQQLKKELAWRLPQVQVIISRMPGETLEPLHNANFANRLAVDLYISIHFYQEHGVKAQAYWYYCTTNPIIDFWQQPTPNLFLPYDKAHTRSIGTTKKLATQAHHHFNAAEFRHYFDVHACCGFPCKPLLGLTMPALLFEGSLKKRDDWQQYVAPMIAAIEAIVQSSN